EIAHPRHTDLDTLSRSLVSQCTRGVLAQYPNGCCFPPSSTPPFLNKPSCLLAKRWPGPALLPHQITQSVRQMSSARILLFVNHTAIGLVTDFLEIPDHFLAAWVDKELRILLRGIQFRVHQQDTLA